jgi:hypothetical protein
MMDSIVVKRNFDVSNKERPQAKNAMAEVDRPIHFDPFGESISIGGGGGGSN